MSLTTNGQKAAVVISKNELPIITELSAEKMNVLYVGIDNPIALKLVNCNKNEIQVSIDGFGTSITADPNNPSNYLAKVSGVGKCRVIVSAVTNGVSREIGSKEFRCKRIPDPVVTIGGKLRGGKNTVDNIRALEGITLVLENFDFEVHYEVVSFQMVYVTKGEIFKAESQSSSFSTQMNGFLDRAQPDDLIFFTEIKVIGPDSQPRKLGQIAFKIVSDQDSISDINKSANIGFKKPKLPAVLSVTNLSYSDNDKTNRLDAKETAYLKFTIENSGKGEAYNVSPIIKEKTGLKGIVIGYSAGIKMIAPGEKKEIVIPITASKEIVTAKAILSVNVTEANGFDADPSEIELRTQEFLAPKVVVAAQQFSNDEGGKARLGIPLNLRFIIQNIGQGEANDVTCNITYPENIFPSDETYYSIGKLKSGESKELSFGFFGNKKYSATKIPLRLNLKEKENYAESKTIELSLDEVLASTQKVEVKAQDVSLVDIQVASLVADVDKEIPVNNVAKQNTYALIIGNEDYSSFQMGLSKEVNADYALNDARIFKEYCNKTLGVPERQIKLLSNATAGQMNQGIAWLANLAKVDNGKAELIVYYSGHGLPDEQTKEPYLIPVDVSGSNVTQGIRLNDVYTKLNENPAQKVTVFLDACFSGGARNQGLVAMKGVKIKPKENLLNGNVVVFTSSSGEESSGVYREKQHGYMTYYLLKKLQETKGDISYSQLANYITETVKKETALTGKIQTPQVNYSSSVDGIWSGWKLK